jgi:hypothetical protein
LQQSYGDSDKEIDAFVGPIPQGKEDGVFTHLYPILLQYEKITNYFRIGFNPSRS